MSYKKIVKLKSKGHGLKRCCRLLEVSRSGFYSWLKRKPSKTKQEDQRLAEKVLSIFKESKARYGSPRIQKTLEREGIIVGKNRVSRLMREANLSAMTKKCFIPKTTVNNPNMTKSPRIFKIKDTEVVKENQVWVSDLTYIRVGNSFCYLVTIMDVFTREIKGWDFSETMDAVNTNNAFIEAVRSAPGSLEGLIFHSDQGSQYCSSKVRKKLVLLKITQSMSRKGNCYDNAYAESLFSTIKRELGCDHFKNKEQAKRVIFEYLNWYNRDRLHSSLGYLSPLEYKERNKLIA